MAKNKDLSPVEELVFPSGTIKLDSNRVSIHMRAELNRILGRIRAKTSVYSGLLDYEMKVGESLTAYEDRAEEDEVEPSTNWVIRRPGETNEDHVIRLNTPRGDDANFALEMMNEFSKYLEGDEAFQVKWAEFEKKTIDEVCRPLHRFCDAQRLWVPEVAPRGGKRA